MDIIYKYSTITIRWDISKEKAVREDLATLTKHLYYICEGRQEEIDWTEDDDVVIATISNPLKTGFYNMRLEFVDSDGVIKMVLRVDDAFSVSKNPTECNNPNGADVTVKLRATRTINVSYKPTPVPAIKGEGIWMEIDTNGDTFMAWGESKKITCRVYNAFHKEITDEVKSWDIDRLSGDTLADQSWGYLDRVKEFAGSITLYHGCYVKGESSGAYDLISDLGTGTSTIFTITATVDSGNFVVAQLEI